MNARKRYAFTTAQRVTKNQIRRRAILVFFLIVARTCRINLLHIVATVGPAVFASRLEISAEGSAARRYILGARALNGYVREFDLRRGCAYQTGNVSRNTATYRISRLFERI